MGCLVMLFTFFYHYQNMPQNIHCQMYCVFCIVKREKVCCSTYLDCGNHINEAVDTNEIHLDSSAVNVPVEIQMSIAVYK